MWKIKDIFFVGLALILATAFDASAQTSTQGQHIQKSGCKCGVNCACRKSGDTLECKCGPNCKCGTHGSEHGDHMTFSDPFLKIMAQMMTQMDSVPLSGSVEKDFLIQMIPHHAAAVEMANYELMHGQNPEMIRLAKSIATEQKSEIAEMNAMISALPQKDSTLDSTYVELMNNVMRVMMKNTPNEQALPAQVDCRFALIMLPHHQAAVDMAKVLLRLRPESPVAIYARRIINDQSIEIDQMTEFIQTNCNN